MSERSKGPGDIPTGQRMKHIGAEMVKSVAHRLSGKEERDQKGAGYVLDRPEVDSLIQEWPAGPKRTAQQMLEQYGPPNEGSPVRLTWYGNGPWKRTEIVPDEIAHNFPAPHTDYVTNWIDYQVPVERFSDLARAVEDGRLAPSRTQRSRPRRSVYDARRSSREFPRVMQHRLHVVAYGNGVDIPMATAAGSKVFLPRYRVARALRDAVRLTVLSDNHAPS